MGPSCTFGQQDGSVAKDNADKAKQTATCACASMASGPTDLVVSESFLSQVRRLRCNRKGEFHPVSESILWLSNFCLEVTKV